MSDEDYCAWCDGFIRGTHFGHEYSNGWYGFFCSRRCLRQAEMDGYEGEWFPKSACFITTAVCTVLGKADDCEELERLRSFRDSYMLTDLHRRKKVEEYYSIAPRIVRTINSQQDAAETYQHLLETWIQPAVNAVKNNEPEAAFTIYTAMMNTLTKMTSCK